MLDWVAYFAAVLYLIDYLTAKGFPGYLSSVVGPVSSAVYPVILVLVIVFLGFRTYEVVLRVSRQPSHKAPSRTSGKISRAELETPTTLTETETDEITWKTYFFMGEMIVAAGLAFYIGITGWTWVLVPSYSPVGVAYYVVTWGNFFDMIFLILSLFAITRLVGTLRYVLNYRTHESQQKRIVE
jgi:hypothetical protein